MTAPNKKPGTTKRPGKAKRQRAYLTTSQRAFHRRIAIQSARTTAEGGFWRRSEYPDLWLLVEAAKWETQRRKRLRGRIVFTFEGKRYAIQLTNLDRIKIHDGQTDAFIAQTMPFQL